MLYEDCIGVVLDTGSQYTKAGFAGEHFPRSVFPTTIGRFRRPGFTDAFPDVCCGNEAIQRRGISNLTWPVRNGMIQDWDEMEKLWFLTFYKDLHVAPEESRIIHSVHPLISRKDSERMSEILFESFAINSLFLVKSPALVLYASGRTSGVVWENGAVCCYAAPVFEGFPIKHAIVSSALTGEALTDRLQKLMTELGYSFTTPIERDLLDIIKGKMCYVSDNYEDDMKSAACAGDSKACFDLPDGQKIFLGTECFQCPEVLFQPSLLGTNHPNIVDDICKSISKCDLEYQQMFYNNVVISGGTSMFSGLAKRLEAELSRRVITLPGYKAHVDAMSSRHFAAWTGGSMLASLSSTKGFWMTRNEYDDGGLSRIHEKFF